MSLQDGQPALELLAEFAVVHSYALAPGQHLIGRGEDAAIRLVDSAVSTRHATVTVIESPDFPGYFEVMIEDVGSKNGTRVNGEAVTAQRLAHGDLILIGHTQLRYVEPGGQDSTETGIILTG